MFQRVVEYYLSAGVADRLAGWLEAGSIADMDREFAGSCLRAICAGLPAGRCDGRLVEEARLVAVRYRALSRLFGKHSGVRPGGVPGFQAG